MEKQAKVWTKEEIRENLQKSDKWCVRGLMAIYAKQTEDEKAIKETGHNNGVGFNGTDANILSIFAEGYTKYGKLTEKQMVILRKKITKYAGQLAKIANKEI